MSVYTTVKCAGVFVGFEDRRKQTDFKPGMFIKLAIEATVIEIKTSLDPEKFESLEEGDFIETRGLLVKSSGNERTITCKAFSKIEPCIPYVLASVVATARSSFTDSNEVARKEFVAIGDRFITAPTVDSSSIEEGKRYNITLRPIQWTTKTKNGKLRDILIWGVTEWQEMEKRVARASTAGERTATSKTQNS